MNPHTQRILSRALPSSLDESKGTTPSSSSSSSSPAAFSFSASLNGGVGLPKEGSNSGEREFKRQREREGFVMGYLFAALNSGLFFFVLFSQRDCPRFEKHIQTLNNPLKKKRKEKGRTDSRSHYSFPSFLSIPISIHLLNKPTGRVGNLRPYTRREREREREREKESDVARCAKKRRRRRPVLGTRLLRLHSSFFCALCVSSS